jgi:ABC-type multidrug transport system permease subunit
MLLAISIGMVIASLAATVRQVTTISNIIYFPISIMSGGLIPIQIVYGSSFLKGLS